MGGNKPTAPLGLAQEKARFDNWVKEDRIPNIRRQHHWKTWLRALGMTEQELRIVGRIDMPAAEIHQIGTESSDAAIQFALKIEDGMAFLLLWKQRDFDAIQIRWPDAPEELWY